MEPPGPTSHRADDQVSLPEGWVRLCSKKAGETFFHHFETGANSFRCRSNLYIALSLFLV